MKMPKRHKKYGDFERVVKFDIFSNYTVYIVFSEDMGESFKKRYGKQRVEAAGANGLHAMGDGHSHIFLRVGNCPTGTIAHECWHVIRRVLQDWVQVDELEDETVAYHLGWLVQKVIDFRTELIEAGVGVSQKTLEQSAALKTVVKSCTKKRRHAR